MLIINACRKSDVSTYQTQDNEMKSKFFNSHKSSDPHIQALNKFVKSKNEKYNFIKEIVKKVGFPYWDKSISVSKSASQHRNLTENETLTYIPFVRDSQFYVNASLIIKTTPTDTTYQFLCDWQYSSFGYDTTNTGWSAMNVFHVFSRLDNSVFNRTKFRITDENLLSPEVRNTLSGMGLPFDSASIIYMLKEPTASSGRSNLWTLVTWCDDYDICISETEYEWVRSSVTESSSLPCSSGFVLTVSVCTDTWQYIPSSGGGGTGGTGGTTGGGSTGGGGSTPPDCEGGAPNRSSLYENPCDPGWVPVYETPAFNPLQYDTIGIKNSIRDSFPCFYNLLKNNILNPNFVAQLQLLNVFNISQYVNLKFDIDWALDSTDDNAHETLDPSGLSYDEDSSILRFATTIHFNPYYVKNASKEALVSTIFHESIHAYIRYMFSQYTRGLINSQYLIAHFPLHWSWLQSTPPSNSVQHVQMANAYIGLIDSLTRVFYNPAATPNIRDEVSNALAWRGLHKSTGWTNRPDTCRARAISWAAENTQKSILQIYNPGGICGNYNLPFNDSLKLSSPCH